MKYILLSLTLMITLYASEQTPAKDPLQELRLLEPKMGNIELFNYVERNGLYDILLPRHSMDIAISDRDDLSLRISNGIKRLSILEEKTREDHLAGDMLDKLNLDIMITTDILGVMLKHRLATSKLYRSKIRGEEIDEQKSSMRSSKQKTEPNK